MTRAEGSSGVMESAAGSKGGGGGEEVRLHREREAGNGAHVAKCQQTAGVRSPNFTSF